MALKLRQEQCEQVTQDPQSNDSSKNMAATWFGILASGLLVMVCYGFAVRLPFYFDDLPKWTWLSGHDLRDIWTTSSENAYYRPLVVTIYKLGQLLPAGK